jgi:hypothetical protein
MTSAANNVVGPHLAAVQQERAHAAQEPVYGSLGCVGRGAGRAADALGQRQLNARARPPIATVPDNGGSQLCAMPAQLMLAACR